VRTWVKRTAWGAAIETANWRLVFHPVIYSGLITMRRYGDQQPRISENSIRVLKGLEPVKQRRACTPAPTARCTSFRKCSTTRRRRSPARQEDQDHRARRRLDHRGRRWPGIPFGCHPTEHAPVIEVCVTQLHAGAIRQAKAGPTVFPALHGRGVSVTTLVATAGSHHLPRGRWHGWFCGAT